MEKKEKEVSPVFPAHRASSVYKDLKVLKDSLVKTANRLVTTFTQTYFKWVFH